MVHVDQCRSRHKEHGSKKREKVKKDPRESKEQELVVTRKSIKRIIMIIYRRNCLCDALIGTAEAEDC